MKIKMLNTKYKSISLYGIFGVLTTILNLASYYLCYNVIKISNVQSVIIAWIIGVLFAFTTNKVYVFESRSFALKIFLHEIFAFTSCRIGTGVLDVMIMYLAVNIFNMDPTFWKIISNIIVIILNYIASKFLIFNFSR